LGASLSGRKTEMNVLEINKRDYHLAELKSWLRSLVSILVVVTFAIIFLDFQIEKKWLIIAVPLIITIANTVTQYHVHAISIEKETNTLLITLQSIISGSKVQNFPLNKVNVIIKENNGLRRLIYGPVVIKLIVNNEDTFRITKRYGFSSDNLKLIAEKIRSVNVKS
jgi:hypothetical protein